MKKQLLISFILIISTSSISAQLSAGDIAFIGYNTDSPDGFTWIALDNIPGGTDIIFTDQGINSTTSWLPNTEDHWRYTTPTNGIPLGTIVRMSEATGTFTALVSSGVSTSGSSLTWVAGGTVNTHNLIGGDQILAYLGSSKPASPPTNFIAGVHGDDGNGSPTCLDATTSWNGPASCVTSTAESLIPNGLTNGVNCVSLFPSTGTEQDNAKYTGSLSGTTTFIRAQINEHTNWDKSNTANQAIAPNDFSTPNLTLSLNDYSLDRLKVYPNPTTDYVHITVPVESVSVLDITGEKVFQVSSSEFSVKRLSPGIYFLNIKTNNGVVTKKLIKN